jgi:hypothetical protein
VDYGLTGRMEVGQGHVYEGRFFPIRQSAVIRSERLMVVELDASGRSGDMSKFDVADL